MSKKIILILLFFLISILFLDNASSDEKVIKTYFNITLVGYEINNTNQTFFNLTIRTEDDPIIINEINKNSNIDQKYLITLIRTLTCESKDIENLTRECLIRVATVDGVKLQSEIERNTRLQASSESIQTENSQLRGQSGNLTVCRTDLGDRDKSLQLCSEQKKTAEDEADSNENDKWLWAGIAAILTALVYYNWGTKLKRFGGVKSRTQKEYASDASAKLDIPTEYKSMMDNVPKEEEIKISEDKKNA